jgi:fumarate reductase subunit C
MTPYTEFHPRWYRKRVSTWWWLKQGSYLVFILRELSSIFVAAVVVGTLVQISALSQGPEAWAALQRWLASPGALVFNAVVFAFVLLHALTWFKLAPRAMVVQVGGKRVPDALVAGANYGAWIVASAVIAWFVLRGGP